MGQKSIQIQDECFHLLLESSLKSIPFNILLSGLITFYLIHRDVPTGWALAWFFMITILSFTRWLYSNYCIKTKRYITHKNQTMHIFILMTGLMGFSWSVCYIGFYGNLSGMPHNIITLVLGGMSSGALASLSVYLPAYYAYLLPMFLPVIAYNYLLGGADYTILATMFSLFVIMLIITARFPSRLLQETIRLSKEKDEALVQIRQISITDGLTGLYNRRYFDQCLSQEINRSKRNNQSLNLIFIDVDDFKLINDNYGHPSGDIFLKNLSQVMKTSFQRASDLAFRIGGDEFAVILSNTSLDDAILICQNLKKNLYETNFTFNTSISIGIVCVSPKSVEGVERLISEADKTLYKAKKEGKNQVCFQKVSASSEE